MKKGWKNFYHYLDDFFSIISQQIKTQAYKNFFLHLYIILRGYVQEKKSLKTFFTEFLNIELDRIKKEVRLLLAKLKKAKDWVRKVLNQHTITRENLQLLLGFLFFATTVVISGQIFLKHLFTTI